jgi:hypothetical protein
MDILFTETYRMISFLTFNTISDFIVSVRLEVLMTLTMRSIILWDVAQCSLGRSLPTFWGNVHTIFSGCCYTMKAEAVGFS